MKKIKEFMETMIEDGICVAFSGGVDSSVILKVACEVGEKRKVPVYAVTFETQLHPKADLPIAREIAQEAHAIHHVIYVNELDNEKILMNPVDRCYHCKYYLFETLQEYCKTIGVKHILDGTNYDDLSQYRPGIQALKDLGIISPFVELGITKKEVREMATKLQLKVSNRPSSPCLATRLPYNTKIDFGVLEMVEEGEAYLSSIGFPINRIRVHQDIARIEIPKVDIPKMFLIHEEVVTALQKIGFTYITLDMEGFRSGSMDVHLNK